MNFTSFSALLAGSAGDDREFARLADGPRSLGQFRADIAGAAHRIRDAAPENAVLLTGDSYWFLVGMLALLVAGIPVILPPNGQQGTLDRFAALAPYRVSDGLVPADLTLANGVAAAAPARLDPARAVLHFYTSGSTGEAKRIDKTLAQLEAEIQRLEAVWGGALGAVSVWGNAPHQHIFGLTFRVLWPALTGRVFGGPVPLSTEALLAQLDQPMMLVMSPAHLNRLDGLPPLPDPLQPPLVLTAGAPLDFTASSAAALLFGGRPVEIFGSTETGAIAWRRQYTADEPWRALPDTEIQVTGAGMLALRSPWLPDRQRYETADRIELVPGGFRYCGRADRIVKIEGKRVSLTELEAALTALPEIAAAAALVLDSVQRSCQSSCQRSCIGAVLVLTPTGQAALDKAGKFRFERGLRRALAQRLEVASLPRRWRFVAAMPIDGLGKRPKSLLEALFHG